MILLENEPYPYDIRVRQEAVSLTEAGYDVTVVAPTGPRAPESAAVIDGVRVIRFAAPPSGRGALGYAREYISAFFRFRQTLRTLRSEPPFDAVIACNPPDFLILLARPLRRRGAALVFDYHDPSPELFEAKFARRGVIYRGLLAMEGIAFRTADVVMTVNDACADLVRGRGQKPAEHVFVVRNSPDPRRIFPVEPRPELRSGREHLVLWIGRMSAKERLDLLLDAAHEIVVDRRRHDVSFAIVGRGDVWDDVASGIADRGLNDVVHLPGEADDELLREYIATADVCVSLDQPNPMNDRSVMIKVLEYMALGKAIVQFPLHEMRRVCGDTTVYASEGYKTDLADKIEQLLDDPGRRAELGSAARTRVLSGLLWTEQVPILLAAVERARLVSASRS